MRKKTGNVWSGDKVILVGEPQKQDISTKNEDK